MNEVELKGFALLADFTEDDCLAIMQVLEQSSLMAGRRLFREGGQSDGMALVVEGTLRLESRRTEQQLRVGAGTALGALALVGMGPRESTAVSETPCEILWLRRSEFRRLVDDAPRTACRLLESIAGEFAGRVRRELDSIAS